MVFAPMWLPAAQQMDHDGQTGRLPLLGEAVCLAARTWTWWETQHNNQDQTCSDTPITHRRAQQGSSHLTRMNAFKVKEYPAAGPQTTTMTDDSGQRTDRKQGSLQSKKKKKGQTPLKAKLNRC